MQSSQIEYPTDWKEYELIDSGDGMKRERFGTYTIARTDPRAIWKPRTKNWNSDVLPASWNISYKHLTFVLKPTQFKHVGIFPEQAVNWNWLSEEIHGDHINVLNLFAYTGGATLAAAAAGASVTHVDSARSAIDWANENVAASNLKNKPIRWIEEDAMKFVLREGKRGNSYDGIILDPPRFGRGSKGEVWKIEEKLPKLLVEIKKILAPNPRFILLNAYTADLSPLVLHHLLADITTNGSITFGELALKETSGSRLLPSGIFARWSK
jgi:23S rRNA (cytosine1962-C5)-methyltransferase